MGQYNCCKTKEHNTLEVKFSNKIDNQDSQNNNSFRNNNSVLSSIKNTQKTKDEPLPMVLLYLTIVNGIKLRIGKEGLENSIRNAKDGITYFGYIEDKTHQDTAIDYVLFPKEGDSKDKLYTGQFFQIAYNTNANTFFLKDLGNDLGTFVKINKPVAIMNNTLINIGDSYLVINFAGYETNPNNLNTITSNPNANIINGTIESIANCFPSTFRKQLGLNKMIMIKVFDHITAQECKLYTFEPDSQVLIKMGRKNYNNQIELNDPLVSKINSTIEYKDNDGWFFHDGDYLFSRSEQQPPKASTNGSWVLAADEVEIVDGMIFKGHSNLFLCTLLNNMKMTEYNIS